MPSREIERLLNKCSAYFDDCLISKEEIVRRYIEFFDTEQTSGSKLWVGFHHGNDCLNAVAIIATVFKAMAHSRNNSDFLMSLKEGDKVVFGRQVFTWGGKTKIDGTVFFKLQAKDVQKGQNNWLYKNYEQNKSKLAPYRGDPGTAPKGIGKVEWKKRCEFLSQILDCNPSDVPSTLNFSIVVIAGENNFRRLGSKISLSLDGKEKMELSDLFPTAYFTSGGTAKQIGRNPFKQSPVILVCSELSGVPELLDTERGVNVRGLVVCDDEESVNVLKLNKLLYDERLEFVNLSTTYGREGTAKLLSKDASFFAITAQYLRTNSFEMKEANPVTEEMYLAFNRIIRHKVVPVLVEGGMTKQTYRTIIDGLRGNLSDYIDSRVKDDFKRCVLSLVRLLNTALFSLESFDKEITTNPKLGSLTSFKDKLTHLDELMKRHSLLQEYCSDIFKAVEDQCLRQLEQTPKLDELKKILAASEGKDVCVIQDKSYYRYILQGDQSITGGGEKLVFTEEGKFKNSESYDLAVITNLTRLKRMDPFHAYNSEVIKVLLYESEETYYSVLRKEVLSNENKLNGLLGLPPDEGLAEKIAEPDVADEEDVRISSDIERMISEISMDSLLQKFHGETKNSHTTGKSEVTHIGEFDTGEIILFSKYYSALVFDPLKLSVKEKRPEKLNEGDHLVFARINDYSKNIVEFIHENLVTKGALGEDAAKIMDRSKRWRRALIQLKESEQLTNKELGKRLHRFGCSVDNAAIYQWLAPDNHVVGPRNLDDLDSIAKATGDEEMKKDLESFKIAIETIRCQRRKILSLIDRAIKEKLQGIKPTEEEGKIVYDNMDRMSETLILKSIRDISSEPVFPDSNLVNRPLDSSDVFY